METTNIICRTGYCPICEKEGAPKSNQPFLVFGSTSNRYRVMSANACHHNPVGYTPHIYKAKVNGSNVIVESACAMFGCDVNRRVENQSWFYFVNPQSWKREIWTLKQWNALVMYKHDFDYQI